MLKLRETGCRKLLNGAGVGTYHLKLPDSSAQAINQRCHLEEGDDSPQHPGKDKAASVQARVSLGALLFSQGCLLRGRVIAHGYPPLLIRADFLRRPSSPVILSAAKNLRSLSFRAPNADSSLRSE